MSCDAAPQTAVIPEPPLSPKDVLGHAFVAARSGHHRDGPAAILDAFYADDRVRRMFVQLAYQFRQVEYIDEARQRVALLFFDTYVPQILTNGTPPQGVYSLVYALAMNVFRSIRKENSADEHRHESYDSSEDGSAEDARQVHLSPSLADDFLPALHSRIDMERAQNEIARRLQQAAGVGLSDRTSNERVLPGISIGSPVEVKAPARRRRNALTSEFSKELNDIKTKLGITNQDFADGLGIGLPTLASYLYARVQTVPDKVMAAARDMIKSSDPHAIKTRQWLDSTPMSSILDAWATSLGIETLDKPKQDQVLAELFGCNVITVWRWRNKEAKPNVAVLIGYDATVAQHKPKRKGRATVAPSK